MNSITAMQAFDSRDREVTTAYQNALLCRGRAGQLAFGLFRAQKRSTLAKSYRGKYKRKSYDGKNEALKYLDAVLTKWGDAMGVDWGWKKDPHQDYHNQVLYVHLKDARQASFHGEKAISKRQFRGAWDQRGGSEANILWYCDAVMARIEPRDGLGPDDIMPFGKHVGSELSTLSDFYCSWLLDWDGLPQWSSLIPFLKGDCEHELDVQLDEELDRILARNV